LVKGDKVWVCSSFVSEFEELADVDYSFQQETFGGLCGEGFGKNKAWVECEYDGGRLVSTKDLYPTKKASPPLRKNAENCLTNSQNGLNYNTNTNPCFRIPTQS